MWGCWGGRGGGEAVGQLFLKIEWGFVRIDLSVIEKLSLPPIENPSIASSFHPMLVMRASKSRAMDSMDTLSFFPSVCENVEFPIPLYVQQQLINNQTYNSM